MFNDAIYNDFLVNVIQQNLLFKQEGLLNFCQKNTKVCHFCEARSRSLSGPRLFLTLFLWIQRSLCKISNKLFIWYVQSMYLLSRAVLIKSLLSLIEVQQSLLFSFLPFFRCGLGDSLVYMFMPLIGRNTFNQSWSRESARRFWNHKNGEFGDSEMSRGTKKGTGPCSFGVCLRGLV